jgi:hypothetical protein
MKNVLALTAAVLMAATGALAQTASSNEKAQAVNQILLLSEADGPGKVVKNAPYTATATTQTTQTLADGSHIVNTTTALLARDSEGRTRREENFPKVGNLQTNASKTVIISDPGTRGRYISVGGDDAEATTISTDSVETSMSNVTVRKIGGPVGTETIRVMDGMPGGVAMHKPGITGDTSGEGSSNVQHESLGTQVIEGVSAEGVRDTRTIPAGAIGNEKPIAITTETWTSPDLQVVVLSKRNDPRFGETLYKLTDITRNEPDPSLFEMPNVKKDSSR